MDSYILLRYPGGADPVAHEFLEQLGHRVMVCPGPGQGTSCPLLTGDGCTLAENAHGSCSSSTWIRPSTGRSLPITKSRYELTSRFGWWSGPARLREYADLLRGLKVVTPYRSPAISMPWRPRSRQPTLVSKSRDRQSLVTKRARTT